MGVTIMRQAIEETVDRVCAEQPSYLSTLHGYLTRIRDGFYDPLWANAIMQGYWTQKVDIYEAHAFAMVWADIWTGAVVHAPIGPIGEPYADSKVTENNERLARLPSPFRAEFAPEVGRGARSDGVFRWDEPLELYDTANQESVTIPPGNAPLEVGYTFAHKTLQHIREEGRVARWAYGSDVVVLLVVKPDVHHARLHERAQILLSGV